MNHGVTGTNALPSLLIILLSLGLLACAGPAALEGSKGPPTVDHVDLARYQGTWYEIARLPMWFQRNCIRSKATYGVLDSGEVSVRNECDTADGKLLSATGRARSVDPATNARLEVRFDNWWSVFVPSNPQGNYWILYLDEGYRTVIVGTPDRKNLWIMARTPSLEPAQYRELVDRARALGFDTSSLVKRQ